MESASPWKAGVGEAQASRRGARPASALSVSEKHVEQKGDQRRCRADEHGPGDAEEQVLDPGRAMRRPPARNRGSQIQQEKQISEHKHDPPASSPRRRSTRAK